MIMMQCNE